MSFFSRKENERLVLSTGIALALHLAVLLLFMIVFSSIDTSLHEPPGPVVIRFESSFSPSRTVTDLSPETEAPGPEPVIREETARPAPERAVTVTESRSRPTATAGPVPTAAPAPTAPPSLLDEGSLSRLDEALA
ncbi:MAG TPA: hypothetical protein ENN69_03195, partial [Spirochaetia bacterium]|nr:hypothetical protein [Spirochaetia bacterium]